VDRVISAVSGTATAALTYSGATGQLTGDGTATYSRDPSGAVIGIDSGAGGQALALDDEHQDLSGTFTADGTALASSTTYDPWGQVIATTGPAAGIGFQGQWTDPGNGQVDMGSRFYSPGKGSFQDQDTAPVGNAYSYADGNPVTLTDLTGHSPDGDSTSDGKVITLAEVQKAGAKAEDAEKIAARDKAAATKAKNTEAQDLAAYNAAASYASAMNSELTQAQATMTSAQAAASSAMTTLNTFVDPLGGLQGVQSLLSHWQGQVSAASAALTAAENPNGPGCTKPLTPAQETTVEDDKGILAEDNTSLGLAQGDEDSAQNLSNALNKAKAVAAKDRTAWQRAQAAATLADNAQSRAEDAYVTAEATYDQLSADATAAERQAEADEEYYLMLLKEYEAQQAAKGKPKPTPKPKGEPQPQPKPQPKPIPKPEPDPPGGGGGGGGPLPVGAPPPGGDAPPPPGGDAQPTPPNDPGGGKGPKNGDSGACPNPGSGSQYQGGRYKDLGTGNGVELHHEGYSG
jgi:RHS repeat-associated protein